MDHSGLRLFCHNSNLRYPDDFIVFVNQLSMILVFFSYIILYFTFTPSTQFVIKIKKKSHHNFDKGVGAKTKVLKQKWKTNKKSCRKSLCLLLLLQTWRHPLVCWCCAHKRKSCMWSNQGSTQPNFPDYAFREVPYKFQTILLLSLKQRWIRTLYMLVAKTNQNFIFLYF